MRFETCFSYAEAEQLLDSGECDAVIIEKMEYEMAYDGYLNEYHYTDEVDYWCHVLTNEETAQMIERKGEERLTPDPKTKFPMFYFYGTEEDVKIKISHLESENQQ